MKGNVDMRWLLWDFKYTLSKWIPMGLSPLVQHRDLNKFLPPLLYIRVARYPSVFKYHMAMLQNLIFKPLSIMHIQSLLASLRLERVYIWDIKSLQAWIYNFLSSYVEECILACLISEKFFGSLHRREEDSSHSVW